MIGGVGQRVLSGVAKKTAGEFFKAVDDVLTGASPAIPAPRDEPAEVGSSSAVAAAGNPGLTAAGPSAAPSAGVYTAPPPPPGHNAAEFLRGAVFGAVVALAGVLVGGLVTRRRG